MYDHKKKQMLGRIDGLPISKRYESKLIGYEKTLGAKPTEAEKHFEAFVADVIRDDANTPYCSQKVFYVTDNIAFIFSNKAVLARTQEVFDNTVRFLSLQKRATPSHLKYLRRVYSHLLIDA